MEAGNEGGAMTGTAAARSDALILSEREARLLQSHLQRHRRWNDSVFVRVVAHSGDLSIYAAPPMGVLSHIHLPLAHPLVTPIDATVSVQGIGFADGVAGMVCLDLPESGTGPAALAVLPPREDWHLPIHGVAGDIAPTVDAAVAEFKSRSVSSVDTDALAAEIWSRPAFGGLPMRVLHTARLLGMLGADSARIAASTRTGWKRLTTIRGQVYVRVPGALDRPTLTVVR